MSRPIFRARARAFASSGAVRSLWLDEALAREPAPPFAPQLPAAADVVVVGGGFTGLWTAIGIKQRDPSVRVVLAEADVCGGGASGRNGGFVMTMWSKFSSLSKLCGHDDGLRFALAAEEAVSSIGAFCTAHDIDAHFRQDGWLWTATSRAQADAWKPTIEAIAATGASPYVELDRSEVAQQSGSPVHLAGVFESGPATVQPALLARGLAKVARQLGVEIYERTPVVALKTSPVPELTTQRGRIRADSVVLATNAWAAAVPQLRRALVVVASDVIATEPIPERLAAIGWRRGLQISDSRRLVNYYRVSEDGRVVFGKGGGTLAMGGRVGASFHRSARRADDVQRQFHRLYPALWDVPAARSWRGPIDYSLSGLPFFCRLPDAPRVVVGAGFSGNGVGPSYLAGQALSALALEQDDPVTPEALRRVPSGRLPPEPLRYGGGLVVRAAVSRKEDLEDAERRPGLVTRAFAALDPTSFVDTGRGSRNGSTQATSAGEVSEPRSERHDSSLR